ncbi:hypothetical protein [Sphingomonas sp. GM_Shp_2]|uniref:hypothetical protein n=1 Tax=Sphingomonas sp. GM_Shp_2 TaxID=2937380 RepID=UPI00226AE910|nr:hypothetical protein [Sphingomonas sp. GM_Shp_2]
MKADVGMLEDTSVEPMQPKAYVGRFVRKQGQYGTVSVFGTVVGTSVEAMDDAKRLFPRDGTVETQGLVQHAGLSAGDWVEFNAVRNSRPRSTEYKASRLRRIPRYAALTEGTESYYRTLLTREGWKGDHRPGLWALRISGDRVVVADLELGKDGALRLPRASTREVRYLRYHDDAVVRLGKGASADDAYLELDAEPAGTFDWSDEADHVARVIRSLSDADDPRVSDIIAWLDLHQEDGRVFAATVDHEVGLDALRSGELADRLRADRDLMQAYVEAASKDEAVAAALAAHAREGHTEERARLRAELVEEIALHRDELLKSEEAKLAGDRKKMLDALAVEAGALRKTKLAEIDREAERRSKLQIEKLGDLDEDLRRRRGEVEGEMEAVRARLAEVERELAAATAERDGARAEADAERGRLREASVEVDRLLTVADRLTTASQSTQSGISPRAASLAYAFDERPAVGVGAVASAIDGMALLSDKGRDLMRKLLVLVLSGELPILYGADAADFVRIFGSVVAPGRNGVLQADPTLISIEDLWARPGSGAPTLLAAAAQAAVEGTAVLVAITGLESSGARFWVPSLTDALRGGALPRALLVCAVASDVDHDEVKALPAAAMMLEVEGVFAPGASMGVLALYGMPDAKRAALRPAEVPTDVPAALKVLGALGSDPGPGVALRLARMAAEASELLQDQLAACTLVIQLAHEITNQDR